MWEQDPSETNIKSISTVWLYTSTHRHLTSQSSSVWSCRKIMFFLTGAAAVLTEKKALFLTLSTPSTQINAFQVRCTECVFPPQADCVQLKSRSSTGSSEKPCVCFYALPLHIQPWHSCSTGCKKKKKKKTDCKKTRVCPLPARSGVRNLSLHFMPDISMTVIHLLGLSKF